MNMDNLATIEPSSTTLDPGAVSPSAAGGGVPNAINEAPSLRDSIEAAVKEVSEPETKEESAGKEPDKDAVPEKGEEKPEKGAEKSPEAKGEEKPKEAAKAAERGADGKFAPKADADKDDGDETPRQLKQSLASAPSRFLPDAKEKWASTPRSVQREVETMIRAQEAREEEHRQVSERYSRIRDFDDMAQANGRDLRESLERVHAFENTMRTSPIAALNMALMEAGPRKSDGQPYSLYEVAQFVVAQGPEGYQRLMQQGSQPQQQQEDPRIAQLQNQLEQVKLQTIAEQVIEPFKAAHPRYDELKDDIALFLQSGKIDKSLSHQERLAAAYDMAERINPSPHVGADTDNGLEPERDRAERNSSGSKSIKSAPGSVSPDEEPERGGSIREQLERAIRIQRRA